jgi:osmotically-inducible protein OsmY
MRLALALALLFAAPACAPLITPTGAALTAGATAGTMATQDRGLDGGVSDNALALSINEAWLSHDPAIFRKVSTSIHEGVVVLTGSVHYRETALRAEALARGVKGVREVINHIKVEQGHGIGTAAADRWITMRLRTTLTFAADVNAVNYAIDTVSGTVFLSGIARDQREVDKVVALARGTSGVKDVVTAIRLRSEPPPPRASALAAASPAPLPSPVAHAAVQPSRTPYGTASGTPSGMPFGTAVSAEPLPPP